MKTLTVIAFALLIVSGCSKGGCTDKTALNYDPKAKWSDHSCKYFIDTFLGTYAGVDSFSFEANDSLVKTSFSTKFTVEAFGTTALSFINAPFYIHGLNVYANPQNFIDTSYPGPYPLSGTIYLKNDTLYYNISLLADTPIVQKHQGFGVKQ